MQNVFEFTPAKLYLPVLRCLFFFLITCLHAVCIYSLALDVMSVSVFVLFASDEEGIFKKDKKERRNKNLRE